MLKLSQVFFVTLFLILGGTLVVAALITYSTIEEIEIKQYSRLIRSELGSLEGMFDTLASSDRAVMHLRESIASDLRVQVLDGDGTVFYQNPEESFENKSLKRYPEVRQAVTNGYGYHAGITGLHALNAIYVVMRIDGPNIRFVRLVLPIEGVMEPFVSFGLKLILLFFLSLFIGFLISHKIQTAIVVEIEKITQFLADLSEKNYKGKLEKGFVKDFSQIGELLKKVAKKLEKSDKQKRKNTAKLFYANRQRSNLLSSISHEFKNPLASMIGYAQTLHDDATIDRKTGERFLEKIINNGHRLSGMLDRLSFINKLENSEVTLFKSRFSLAELTNEVLNDLQQNYSEREIWIRGDDRMVLADRALIGIVMKNLIENALKYSDSDIAVRIDESVSVQDSGKGIEPEEIEKITKKYYRIQKEYWNNSMGMGLAIVKYILKLHKSELLIESVPGRGTVVSFSLPDFRNNTDAS